MTCGLCEDGWRTVHGAYVDARTPTVPPHPGPDAPIEARVAWEVRKTSAEILAGALARTVYPCSNCQPVLFYRWAGRHFLPDHNRKACDECRKVDAGEYPDLPAEHEPAAEQRDYTEPEPSRHEQEQAF